jgi:hypothetical protein
MAALLPRILIGRQLDDARILIVLPPEPDISQCGITNLLFPKHAISRFSHNVPKSNLKFR